MSPLALSRFWPAEFLPARRGRESAGRRTAQRAIPTTARRRKQPPGRARSPAMSQPGGPWQFGVDERGKGRGVEKSQRDFIIQPGVGRRSRTTLGGESNCGEGGCNPVGMRIICRGWCAKLFPDGRRRGQRRRGLPVREIGEVMFADGCRQSFAGVRVQALPFFQRRVIRQRDGKKFAPFFRALEN